MKGIVEGSVKVWYSGTRLGAQYSAAVQTGASVEMRSVLVVAPHVVSASRRINAVWAVVLALALSRCLNDSVRLSFTLRYIGDA